MLEVVREPRQSGAITEVAKNHLEQGNAQGSACRDRQRVPMEQRNADQSQSKQNEFNGQTGHRQDILSTHAGVMRAGRSRITR